MATPVIYIGTSGWIYKDWHDAFYPDDVASRDLLRYYATKFSTVEINATFYRLATEKAAANWRKQVSGKFVFAVKGSRFITHIKRLKAESASTAVFFERIAPLGRRIGPILWQLPPTLKKDSELLRTFIGQLPAKFKHAVEFRDESWLSDDVFQILKERNVANVWISSLRMPPNREVTADFIYLRFHGLKLGVRHNYTRRELAPWADQLMYQAEKKRTAFVYFNNDGFARAPENAELLREMVNEVAAHPAR